MDLKKRVRSANFTTDEKLFLLQLVAENKNIIENKTTNSLTNKYKEQAWELITKQFNSKAPNTVFRTCESLKKYYDNIKRKTRKDVSNERMSMLKTGGGEVFKPTDRITHELAVSVMNHKTVHGLQNNFDDDFIPQPSCSNSTINNYVVENNILKETNAPANEVLGECYDLEFENEVENILSENEIMESQSTEKNQESLKDDVEWAKWNPVTLKTPVNNKLKRKTSNKISWSNRRRPSAQVETRQQYLELGKEKLEFVLLQKSAFEKNEAIRIEREKEEFELKKIALNLDIEIKKAQLHKLTKN